MYICIGWHVDFFSTIQLTILCYKKGIWRLHMIIAEVSCCTLSLIATASRLDLAVLPMLTIPLALRTEQIS
eukprot:c32558_g1_i1 orf=2-211(-)